MSRDHDNIARLVQLGLVKDEKALYSSAACWGVAQKELFELYQMHGPELASWWRNGRCYVRYTTGVVKDVTRLMKMLIKHEHLQFRAYGLERPKRRYKSAWKIGRLNGRNKRG